MAASTERRKRKRVELHWPVRLLRQPGTPPVNAATENLSSEGFYCTTQEPFKTGERLECEMVIPGDTFGFSESEIRLKCQVTIRRVEPLPTGFGLGCHIEDYALVTGPADAGA